MSVLSPIIACSHRPKDPVFEKVHRLDEKTEALTINDLKPLQPSLEKFIPLTQRVQELDRDFFLSKKRTVKELTRAVEIASKLNHTKFQNFLEFLLSIAEIKTSYQTSLNYLKISTPTFFQTVPKITGSHQISKNLQIPILEWEAEGQSSNPWEASLQLLNHLNSETPSKLQFETLEEMEITFNHLRKFLIDPISLEVNRNFCVTRMLWVSFFLEKLIGIKCLECYLAKTGEHFFLNKTNLDLASSLELAKYQTSAFDEEETKQLQEHEDMLDLAGFISKDTKVFNWNFHAAVLVFCKEDPKSYVFDLIAPKPIRFDLWDQIFNGTIILRSDCRISNIFDAKIKNLTTFDYCAKETQWRLDKEIQHVTLQTISASYQSALKGDPSKTLYLTRPFIL